MVIINCQIKKKYSPFIVVHFTKWLQIIVTELFEKKIQ